MDALQKLGIDGWSVLLYLVNFGILLLIIKVYVLKPLFAYVDKRREAIATNMSAAEKMRTSIEKEREAEGAAREEREAALQAQVRSAKEAARDEAKNTMSDAELQREAILSQARAVADQTIAGAMGEAEQEVLDRIKTVVMHVLKEDVPEKTIQDSVKKSWAKFSSN
ncbi:ATP synthase F0 subunit B [Candidatus Uhrbacteria bacterium]|jgi:F-type H+-transporting ATPase subunit b|nr:ATP synthase F0 subunit B [Candidatus Uhrbacteria bacterium]